MDLTVSSLDDAPSPWVAVFQETIELVRRGDWLALIDQFTPSQGLSRLQRKKLMARVHTAHSRRG
jgi:hypothetical protein